MGKLIYCCSFLAVSFVVVGQERCGTVEYQKLLQQKNPGRETIDQFESWVTDKMNRRMKNFQPQVAAAYVVPVVVHVINNGESIGSGTNISDAQIMSQIQVLNADFQRMNADTTQTMAEFKPVAGKFPITFVLAKQDPNGQTTNGIVRVTGTKTSWDVSDNYALKALSYWPAENYLNIWVTDLSGGYLGYTQLPVSSTLQGLEDSSNDRLTDGVVIDYQVFGAGSNFSLTPKYNLGRTTTHEVGHFFGLRHVWGDVFDCTGTDYVSDTPTQDTSFIGLCPSTNQLDCGGDAMFDDYMNYTDDACMNIFSKGQVARMDVIINNSPRRVSLLTSPGLQAPVPVANDVAVRTIASPGSMACSGSLMPSITIQNWGTNTINSTQIQFSLNGNSQETKTFSGLNLAVEGQTTLTFSPVTLGAGATDKFSFQVMQTNGTTDGNAANDTLSVFTSVAQTGSLPLVETFNTTPASWSILNPDGLITWKNIALPGSKNAMYLDFYDYDNTGSSDWLITPVLDLTNATIASLSFDYAYSVLSGGSNDRLRVLVSSSCDFTNAVEIFNKSGGTLATAPSSGNSFVPTASQWASVLIVLNQFVGQKIQIAFEGVNDYGNNLYLDNVSVLNYPVVGFALNPLVTPSPVSCLQSTKPVISVKNLGNETITSFEADVYINGQKSVQQITGVQINPATSKNILLAQVAFSGASNSIAVTIKSPNGASGSFTKDSLNAKIYISSPSDIIPLRQNFDGSYDTWTSVSPQSGSIWHTTATNKSQSMIFDAYTNLNLNEQAWLVSPILDFSKIKKASVFFETSYANRSTSAGETFQVFSSTDCGETFDKILLTSTGADLKNTDSNSSWTPASDLDWTKRYVNLDSLAGKENVRFAFVATNQNGNNLYLDNIEFFVDDNEFPPSLNGIVSVYGGTGTPLQVTFNLPERQLVHMQVYDVLGHIVSDDMLSDTLNQTYTIDTDGRSRGIYIVRIQTQSPSLLTSTKVLFGF